MATKKAKPQKRSSAVKGGKAAKKAKPIARPKARPAAKPVKKAAKKPAKPAKKVAKKAPAKAAKKPAKPIKRPVGKAPAKKAPPKAPAKKVVAPARPVAKTPVAKQPAVKAPEAKAPPAAKAAVAKPAPVEKVKKPQLHAAASTAAAAPAAPPAAAAPAAPTGSGEPPRRGRKPRPRPEGDQATAPAGEGETKVGGLPPIRPYRGTKFGKEKKLKPLRPRKSKPRDRFSKLFAEFETKPATSDKKKKRRVLDEDEEETSFSVIREQMKLQIMSPEQIRADVHKKFLAGEQVTCPVGCGGIAEIVRVGTLDDGSGEVWIECLSCAQRERFVIAKATPPERHVAQKAMEENGDAVCPRHRRTVPLRRRGRDLVCPECGVLFPES